MVTRCTSWAYVAAALLLALVCPATAKYSGGTGEPNDPYQIATAADLITLGETLPGIGVAGDSLTDEYSQRGGNYGDASALCWVDLLGRLRGPTSPVPELTFGDYQASSMSSPRYRGYTYNWALAGANTATLLAQGQHTGLANQVRQGQVQYVALVAGTNDFYPAYEALYSETTPIPGADGKQYPSAAVYVDSIVARYTTALDTVSDAGAKVVMATIADHGSLPGWAKDFPEAEKRQHVTNATIAVNDRLRNLALERGLPFVDVYELLDLFYVDSTPSYVGDVPILKAVAPTPDARYAVLPDGFHPGTIWQGLLANAFLEACNRMYKTNFTPLSDREILVEAGLAHLASAEDTFFDIRPYVSVPACAKYSGGTGEPNDPYQIATAADLIALGETPEDYDKHFLLTADIDLDPNLPGGRVFERAVIAPDTNDATSSFDGTGFTGVFDGGGHVISHLTIIGVGSLGLFGQLNSRTWDGPDPEVRNLGLVDVNIVGSGSNVGGLVGGNAYFFPNFDLGIGGGMVTNCYSSGSVSGKDHVGGLVGYNYGALTGCYANGAVAGTLATGGLVGRNYGAITGCYTSGVVAGTEAAGGLVGQNYGTVTTCHTSSAVAGDSSIGGLVGANRLYKDFFGSAHGGCIDRSYSAGAVSGNLLVGGLLGYKGNSDVIASFWDIETSGQMTSDGGTGKTTPEMYDIRTYQSAGWDFWGEREDGLHEIWMIPEGGGYPVLALLNGYTPPHLAGLGTPEDPYLIASDTDLGAMVNYSPNASYRLTTSLDLSGIYWSTAVVPLFGGTFDGDGHVVSHLAIRGRDNLGLFGHLTSRGEVRNLGVVDVDIIGSASGIGGIVGGNGWGTVSHCYSSGSVSGYGVVGGLVGYSGGYESPAYGTVIQCHSTGSVSGFSSVGGLVGANFSGSITHSYSTSTVTGSIYVGGLVGYNSYDSDISASYSTGTASGNDSVGGLLGRNDGDVLQCYSSGSVSGDCCVGGLVGGGWSNATASFWDSQASGQTMSAGGIGKTTAEMQTVDTFLDAGWDFLGETANGSEDIWWINEGKDYPRLWWEATEE